MASLIAWLDASVEEQRRMREIIRLFADRESRDELGISQFRDALSDILFPGTSVLLTRARYLLFVPWCLQKAAEKPDPIKEADRYERALIGAIRESDDYAGLLGLRAGVNLREESGGAREGPLSGLTFVVTGRLDRLSRDAAESLVKRCGGAATSSVTKKTDYLIVGAEPGSKLAKAEKLGTQILDEDQFFALLAAKGVKP